MLPVLWVYSFIKEVHFFKSACYVVVLVRSLLARAADAFFRFIYFLLFPSFPSEEALSRGPSFKFIILRNFGFPIYLIGNYFMNFLAFHSEEGLSQGVSFMFRILGNFVEIIYFYSLYSLPKKLYREGSPSSS